MRYISLFSGIGGFDIAFTEAGMECVGMCEIDKNAQEVLKRNFPGVDIYDDVKEVGSETHERGSVELICGGFPCQDLSIAGKRKGLAGERSGLWFEFARIIDELEPGWVVIENVPGLLSSDGGKDFAVILRWLVERGYGVSWRVLDAQYFGVPQRRRRVFVVASFGNGRSAEVLFEREGMFGDIEEGGQEGQRVANTLAGGSSKCHSDITSGQQDGNLVAIGHSGGATLKVNKLVNTLNAQTGSETTAMFNGIWEPRSQDGTPRIHESGDDPTLNTAKGGQRQPCVGVRRLTPTECARLQGFPDDWNDWLSDSARYRQFGNAVAVPVVKWIAERIVKYGKPEATNREWRPAW